MKLHGLDEKAPDFGEIGKAMEESIRQDKLVAVIATLAIEYEAKTITAERFSERVCQMLKYHATSK